MLIFKIYNTDIYIEKLKRGLIMKEKVLANKGKIIVVAAIVVVVLLVVVCFCWFDSESC